MGQPRWCRFVVRNTDGVVLHQDLPARTRDLDAAPVGAFTDVEVQAALGLPRDARPLYLMPVGGPR